MQPGVSFYFPEKLKRLNDDELTDSTQECVFFSVECSA